LIFLDRVGTRIALEGRMGGSIVPNPGRHTDPGAAPITTHLIFGSNSRRPSQGGA
jgi:hypothetical protein